MLQIHIIALLKLHGTINETAYITGQQGEMQFVYRYTKTANIMHKQIITNYTLLIIALIYIRN